MPMIRVSIIIPAYNAAQLIDRSLGSALRQTYPAIEYVVVDDCSTDDTAERVERLRQASDRGDAVKLVRHERNRGVAAARNSGLHAATGDYIYFLDSDDELPPDAIATLVALVDETSPVDLVLGEVEVTGVARSRIAHIDMQEGRVDGQKAILSAFLAGRWPDMTCNKLERRAFLERHRMAFVEGIVHEDALWGFELAMNADSMVVSRKVTGRLPQGDVYLSPARGFYYARQKRSQFHFLADGAGPHRVARCGVRIADEPTGPVGLPRGLPDLLL